MAYLLIAISLLISIFLSALIIPRVLVVAFRKKLFDIPDERKVHSGIIPRLGGITFVPTILFALCFTTGLRYLIGYEIPSESLHFIIPEFYFMACGLTLLYLSGIKDDLVGLRYRSKFVIQIIAASLIPLSGLWINNLYGIFGINELTPWLGIPFTILLTVFIVNAINLIDGIDGLASGLSSISLLTLGSIYVYYSQWIYATLAFSTLGVLLPFFYYNVFGKVDRCKKIFMGDTGSLTLGYILAFLAIRYASYNPQVAPYSEGAIIVAFSTLIIPMFDVIRVVLLRARTQKNLFQPDKNHIHHKFLAMGLSPRKSMILILVMAAGFSITNILLMPYVNNNILFFTDISIWTGLNMWFDKIRNIKNTNN
ncbi:MraY family glycosyltransferase [Parabacteroides faecis]|uniref:UDP-N-acetylmuramyl pentapeptide phosphotransferase/UDP-N-acetylglucosamine-1-phosphate transferase n=1 Tax=Parabacteroides faecis TaxID=1217282 RepID=A0ABR6KHY8_9BACT|nr:MraY family glycosyltransferase [Parabacteroides faecis]MBB4621129.1 UDP-N-acetylmuramyl pentapeptide phosphotransferase/UDP-N-acetylglucosamine-1-phosphate transferase [Parabacteroides faecis]